VDTLTPADLHFDPERLSRVEALCRGAVARGEVPAIAVAIARHGRLALSAAWGQAEPDSVWLIASVTKPVVAAGVCLLIERGEVALDDPVVRVLPAFAGEDRRGITLRHLLTHTSGLPDMLPENVELRRAHAPLDDFVRRICTTPLLFEPGTEIRYQSTGIALLGAITELVTGLPCREFLRREFFEPLGMGSCALGWRPELETRVVPCALEEGQEPSDWDWNSAYWRDFGAPWGGMFATAPEYLRFLQMLLEGGAWEGRRYVCPATLREMTRNQTADLPCLPEPERRKAAWGLGWRLAAVPESEWLGDLVSRSAYGHIGATGTVAWNDPETGVSFAAFTSQPRARRLLSLLSNAVAAAALER
jgi:CubicO group peptidase (beta-lactamase class C family)